MYGIPRTGNVYLNIMDFISSLRNEYPSTRGPKGSCLPDHGNSKKRLHTIISAKQIKGVDHKDLNHYSKSTQSLW